MTAFDRHRRCANRRSPAIIWYSEFPSDWAVDGCGLTAAGAALLRPYAVAARSRIRRSALEAAVERARALLEDSALVRVGDVRSLGQRGHGAREDRIEVVVVAGEHDPLGAQHGDGAR